MASKSIEDTYIVENIRIKKKLPFTISIELEEKLARVVLRTKTPINITHRNGEEKAVEDLEDGRVAGDQVSHNKKDIEDTDDQGEEQIAYSEEYYYLDVNGIVVSSVEDQISASSKFPVIEIQTSENQKINNGQVLLNRETIELVFKAYELIHKMPQKLSVAYMILDLSLEDEITFMTTEQWQGMLSTSISLETQIKKLELALEEKIKDKRSTLQYVDLRIKDRVYFK